MFRSLLMIGLLSLPAALPPAVASAQTEARPGAAADTQPRATTPAPVPNIPPRIGAPADRVGNMRSGPSEGAPFSGGPSGTRGIHNASPSGIGSSPADSPPPRK
jgi:hypothetical protein